jgi:hypothetical protein
MSAIQPIRVSKGELYFPTREAALAFAAHLGLVNPIVVPSVKGWSIKSGGQ